jgi:hypothetical protein
MPQMGVDTKTDRLTDCQSQCDFDLIFGSSCSVLCASALFPPKSGTSQGYAVLEDVCTVYIANV